MTLHGLRPDGLAKLPLFCVIAVGVPTLLALDAVPRAVGSLRESRAVSSGAVAS